MNRIFFTFALSSMAVLPLLAQQGDVAQQHAGSAEGISREALHDQLNGVKRAIKTAVKEVESDARKREELRDAENRETSEKDRKALQGVNDAIGATARAIIDNANANTTNISAGNKDWHVKELSFFGVIAAFVILLGGACAVMFKRGLEKLEIVHETKKVVVENLVVTQELLDMATFEKMSEPLFNPTPQTLEGFAKHHGKKRVKMIIPLSEENSEVVCEGEPRDKTPDGSYRLPIVWFHGEKKPASWEKRIPRAADWLKANPATRTHVA